MKKIILHLCADTGSDSYPYSQDPEYEVILVGSKIGVENYHPPENVYGIIANPVCTEFSTARSSGKARNPEEGMFLVEHCLRIIEEAKPTFWVIENPAKGVLKKYIGEPKYIYEPWWYGSPWTKKTALWGEFNIPDRKYYKWEDVPKLETPSNFIVDMQFQQGTTIGNTKLHAIGHDKETGDMIIITN